MPEHWSDNEKQTVKAGVLAEVNSHILEVARESPACSSQWEFFCECGQPDCSKLVTMTVDEYSSLREGGGRVLAPGHGPNREESETSFAEDARELLAQARQRARRAHAKQS